MNWFSTYDHSLIFLDRFVPVRGMMYYRRALALQCFLDMADDSGMIQIAEHSSALFDTFHIHPITDVSDYYFMVLDFVKKITFSWSVSGAEILGGNRQEASTEKYLEQKNSRLLAVADMKFTFVVSCQVYGQQKKSSDSRDRSCSLNILNLMLE